MSIVQTPAASRPRLVLAHADATFTADALGRFRSLGWEVFHTQAGPEARTLARKVEAELVILDAELEGESGWLTCAKLTQERPGRRVVLLADSPCHADLAELVGASAIVSRVGGLNALMRGHWMRRDAA